MGVSFFGFSATIASVVISSPAIEAASCRAVRTTLVGSMIPLDTKSPTMQLRWRNPHKPRAAMVSRPLGQRQPLRHAARPIRECRSLNTIAKRENRRRRCYTMGRRVNRRRSAQSIRLRETQSVRSSLCPAVLSAATLVSRAERGLIHNNLFPGGQNCRFDFLPRPFLIQSQVRRPTLTPSRTSEQQAASSVALMPSVLRRGRVEPCTQTNFLYSGLSDG
jgi:hypothetical protein